MRELEGEGRRNYHLGASCHAHFIIMVIKIIIYINLFLCVPGIAQYVVCINSFNPYNNPLG